VVVERLDAAGLAKLRAAKTDRVRVYNVWATWCPPCVKEFPDLVSISRQFDMRNVDLITVSMDKPADEAKVAAFLTKQQAGVSRRGLSAAKNEGRATNHFLFTGSPDELAAALDPEMLGPVPHTLVVAPNGKILYRHTGIINRLQVVGVILDEINRFYGPKRGK
jgi:thiol-disulfide isomerase/thioredoxin